MRLLLVTALLGAWTLPAWGDLDLRTYSLLDSLSRERLHSYTEGSAAWSDNLGEQGSFVYSLKIYDTTTCRGLLGCSINTFNYVYAVRLDDGRVANFKWTITSYSGPPNFIKNKTKSRVTTDDEVVHATFRKGKLTPAEDGEQATIELEIREDVYRLFLTHKVSLDKDNEQRMLAAIPKTITYPRRDNRIKPVDVDKVKAEEKLKEHIIIGPGPDRSTICCL